MIGSQVFRWHRRRRPAYSLFEMLAVITIIGILAAVVMPRVTGHARLAKENCCRQFQSDLNAALERYSFDNGNFPASLDDLHPEYYSQDIPHCPVDKSAFSIDPATNRIAGHGH